MDDEGNGEGVDDDDDDNDDDDDRNDSHGDNDDDNSIDYNGTKKTTIVTAKALTMSKHANI